MNLANKNKKVMIFLILVVIVVVSLLSIILLKKFKINSELNAVLEQNIIDSGWPKSVPLIKSEFLKINKQGENSWAININEPVDYEFFREYLIELYNMGFKPIAETESKSPKLLSLEEPSEDGFILFWAGQNSEYIIEAFWQKNDLVNYSGEELDDDSVTVFLYLIDEEKTSVENVVIPEKDVEIVSGDVFLNSGDDLNSGEILIENETTSGEWLFWRIEMKEKKSKRKNVIVVGCSRFGGKLAGSLSSLGYNVTIIDKNENSFLKLPDNYSGYEVCADGTDANILKENGIENAQIFIAVTESENVNILAAKIASEIFNVPEVYLRLTNVEKDSLITNENIKAIYPFKLSIDEFTRISSVEIDEEE